MEKKNEIKLENNEIKLENCNLSVVKTSNGYAIFDTIEKKNILEDITDVDIEKFNEGMLPIKTEDGWKFFNVLDRTSTLYHYKYVDQFKNGFAFVSTYLDGEGIINKMGYEVVQPSYKLIGKNDDDFVVGKDRRGEYFLFDKKWHKIPFPYVNFERIIRYSGEKNTFIVEHRYDDLYRNDQLFRCSYKERREILNCKTYYTFYPIDIDGFILVEKDKLPGCPGKYFALSFNGSVLDINKLHNEDYAKVKTIVRK